MRRGFPLLLAAAALLAGCGDDSTDEANSYVGEVNEATSALNSELNRISSEAATVSSPQDAERIFKGFATEIEAAATTIADIEPPSEVSSQHDQLTEELTVLASTATNTADEIAQGGPAAVQGASSQFIDDARRAARQVDATIAEINSILQSD